MSSHIAHHQDQQIVHSAEVGALVPVFRKSTIVQKPNLLRGKNTVNITAFNVRKLNIINQQPKLTASAAEKIIDIICI